MSARNYTSTATVKTVGGAGLNAGVTTIAVSPNKDSLPTVYPYTLVIDPDTASEEIVTVRSLNTGDILNITRGQDGTTDVSHDAGAVVKHMITPRDLQEPQNHIEAASAYTIKNDGENTGVTGPTISKSVHGIASGEGTVVGTLKPQTLTNKTLNSPTINGATLTGTVVLPSTTSIGNVSSTEIGYVDGVTSAIQTQLNTNTPVGTIVMYGGTTAPPTGGWLLCDGQSTTGYTALAAVVGANVPDLRGRVPLGYGTSVDAGITARTSLFAKLGVETVALSIGEMPSHAHNLDVGDGAGSVAKTSWMDRNASHAHTTAGGGDHQHNINTAIEIAGSLANDTQINWLINAKTTGGNYLVTTAGDGPHNHGINGTDTNHRHDIASQGSGTAHQNMQPSTVVNFIIKY